MLQRIIYLMQVPLSSGEYYKFGLDLYQKQGFKVEVWECTPFLNKKYEVIPTPPELQTLKKFSSATQVQAETKKLNSQDLIINLLPKKLATLNIFRALNKCNAKSIEVRTNAIAALPPPLGQKLKRLNLKKLIDLFIRSPKIWYLFKTTPDYLIYGGKVCFPHDLACGEKNCFPSTPNYTKKKITKIIPAHALDYDAFLKFMQKQEQQLKARPEQYIVFLDQYLPFHSDFIVMQKKPIVTPEKYYPALCNFFDKLEQELNMPVLIAVHPRSNYPTDTDFFGQRPMSLGKSLELIEKSNLVLSHSSTAINFAVMAEKPLLFLNTEELNPEQGNTITYLGQLLGAKVLNIDNLNPKWSEDILNINKQTYKKYMNDFIKEEHSQNLPFWEIVLKNIQEDF